MIHTRRAWENGAQRYRLPTFRTIPSSPSNTRSRIAFTFAEPETRATQVHINLADNVRLDGLRALRRGREWDEGRR